LFSGEQQALLQSRHGLMSTACMILLRYTVLTLGTLAWFAPFPIYYTRGAKGALTKDYSARWGILLECLSFSLLWQGHFWLHTPAPWQLILSAGLFVIAAVTSWTASIALSLYLRLDAALDTGHQLIRSGPYRFVRNPIYSSMLCVILATALLLTPLWLSAVALAVFLLGTAIRIRAEEKLLAARFGKEFQAYRNSVPRLIPFVWL
jgi:protein-S-isoprenylcysteine O-methyltransferase Ste14